jgi:hypothetical protein
MTRYFTRICMLLLASALLVAGGCQRRTNSHDRKVDRSRAGLQVPIARVQAQAPVQVVPPPRPGNAGVECLAIAQHVLRLADQTAFNLCVGAGSTAPTDCFAQGRQRTMLLDPQLVALCRCAASPGPVDCYEQARTQAFLTDPQLIQMCAAIVTQQQYIGDCASRGY